MYRCKKQLGFTLAEVLIALGILGVIAAFAIPKILQIQQNQTYSTIANEAAGTISTAFQQHLFKGLVSSSTVPADLAQYMNYVKLDTSGSQVDERPNYGSPETCNASTPCIKLHNGAAIWFDPGQFGGTTSLNCIAFLVDPDGVYTGKYDSLKLQLYYNGYITTRNNVLPNTMCAGSPVNPLTNADPAWFSWGT